MPVLDASVAVAFLAGGEHAAEAAALIVGEERTWWAPHLIDAEIGHALRRVVAAGELSAADAGAALADAADLPLVRVAHVGLAERAWELRDNVSFYDALYVALAERVRTELVTLDGRLARAAAGIVDVVVLGDGAPPTPH